MSDRSTTIKTNTIDPLEVFITGTTKFAIRLDSISTVSVLYIGYASIGSVESEAVWQIAKMDESGTPTDLVLKYAGGGAFNQVWDNRTSLTYS